MSNIKNNKGVIKNNSLEEISLDKIKLPSKYVHNELNQEIWNGDKIKKNISKVLKVIAKDFYDFLKIDAPIEGIWFTGSLANYNWTKFSDIDLHILVDYSKINKDESLVLEYLSSKKDNWMNLHNIEIKNFDVEVYAQDINEKHSSTGVYDIMNDEWIRKPSKEKPSINKSSIKKKIKKIINKIENLSSIKNLDKIQEEGNKIKDNLKKMRKAGLQTVGEFSEENLVFKYLRNNGYIEELFNIIRNAYDKSLTVNEEEKTSTFDYNEEINIINSDEVLKICRELNRKNKNFDESDIPGKILKYQKYALKKIPVSTLDLNNVQFNREILDKYKEIIKTNPDYSPIIINSENNEIIDGKHRAKALEEMGYDSVRAYVSVLDIENNANTNESVRKLVRSYINEDRKSVV